MADDPSAVLLIRVWLEGEDRAFRARLSGIGGPDDAAPGGSTVAVTATPGDVVVAVERWLAEFLEGARQGGQ
ncbi:hypothetical protein [Blastococcus sp. URHD0036]|uniref:hypothetical protein n=1 Tax=Blastococcus sp. URHD0036 TaxID=1380356 RepID=UPI001E3FC33F|nr:hypothetical protein [Blastococcus sp. URHD0036]